MSPTSECDDVAKATVGVVAILDEDEMECEDGMRCCLTGSSGEWPSLPNLYI